MDIANFIANITLVSGLCFAFGFILVIIEMFHPGFGFPGILGAVLLITGVCISAQSLIQLLIMLIIIIALLCVALTIVLKSAIKGRLSKILVLHEFQKKESGYIGNDDLEYFLGKEGTTITMLRPAGTADFEGIKLDVVSEGGFIKKDSTVKIIEVQGRRIVVREIK
jgi:membrane-bound ClpP family serine protease